MLQFDLDADTPGTIFHTNCSCFMASSHSQDQDVVGLSRRELLALVLDRVKSRACSIHTMCKITTSAVQIQSQASDIYAMKYCAGCEYVQARMLL